MITPEIVAYITSERAKGTTEPIIKANLLANGWTEADIAEALAALASGSKPGAPSAVYSDAELRRYRLKKTWLTFAILVVADTVAIILLGGQGLFGVSLTSIVARLVVIYIISYFTSKGSKPEKTMAKSVGTTVIRIVGAILLAFVIGIGLLFALCLFAFSGHSGL